MDFFEDIFKMGTPIEWLLSLTVYRRTGAAAGQWRRPSAAVHCRGG